MGLIGQIERALAPVNRMLSNDGELIVSLIWKVFVDATYSKEDGYATEIYDEYRVSAIRLTNMSQLENWSVSSSLPVMPQKYNGTFKGDPSKKKALLLVKPSDLPPGATKKDKIEIEGSPIFNIVTFDSLFNLYICVEVSE